MLENLYDRHDETTLQRQQLSAMQARQFLQYSFTIIEQMNLDAPPIPEGTAAFDKPLVSATGHQRNDAVMLHLRALREFPDHRPVAAGIAFDMQQQ